MGAAGAGLEQLEEGLTGRQDLTGSIHRLTFYEAPTPVRPDP